MLVVTGDLGASYLGLQILKREKKIFLENPEIQPDLQGHDYTIGRQLKPNSKEDIIKKFQNLNIVPTSMIDISDGLSSEILHISKSSNVGVTIYEDKIPLDPTTISLASELNLNPVICALSGGEDYELLFTIDQDQEREKFDIKEYLKFFKPFFYNLAIYSLLIFYLCFFIFGVSVAIWLWMFFQGLRFFQLINKQNSFVSKS